MIISSKEAAGRLSSPLNIARSSDNKRGMSLFGLGIKQKETPRFDELRSEEEKLNQPKTEEKSLEVQFNPFSSKIENPPKPEQFSEDHPNADELLDDAEAKIKLGLAHDSAINLMQDAITEMRLRVNEIKPEKLPSVISAASKVVEGIRKERLELRKGPKGQEVHHHYYMPEQRKISDFEVIEVG